MEASSPSDQHQHPPTTVITSSDPQSPIHTQYSFPYGDNTHSAPTTCA
ncbi:MAG: hypothetical protein ACRC3G_02705 [Bacteroidales bacterium]